MVILTSAIGPKAPSEDVVYERSAVILVYSALSGSFGTLKVNVVDPIADSLKLPSYKESTNLIVL